METEQRKERLEEEFEFLLSDTPQVTPGKPLQDVSIFLQVGEAKPVIYFLFMVNSRVLAESNDMR